QAAPKIQNSRIKIQGKFKFPNRGPLPAPSSRMRLVLREEGKRVGNREAHGVRRVHRRFSVLNHSHFHTRNSKLHVKPWESGAEDTAVHTLRGVKGCRFEFPLNFDS